MIDFKKQIARELNNPAFGLTDEEVEGMIEIPADTSHGDYAFPCFKLARTLRKAPPLIAADVAERIAGSPFFEKVEQVNAYVNMFLSREQVAGQVVSEVLKEKDDFGRSDVGHGKTVIVEYSSPNIAKPFHIGHIRSTVIGNAIYKLYDETGYNVVRINHLGDYGTQFGKMIVAYRMWGNHDELAKDPIKTLLGYYTRFHKEAEKDPTLDEKAREAFAKLEAGNEEEVQLWKKFRELSLKEFNRVYDMLGITFDSYAGESFYSDKMPAVIEELKEKGLLQESRGAQIVDLESMGISTPAVIQKSDGSSLYATRDIAAAIYRKQTYDFYKCIYVVASQQNLHFQQWKAVLQLMGYDWQKDCVHVPFGLVSLPEGTMSTRNGRVVFLEDVLKTAVEKTREIIAEKNTEGIDVDEVARQVGIGAVIFQELSNNRIKDYVFDWNNVTNFDGETGPYVQYTHARACSVLRKAGEADLEKMRSGGAADYGYLTSESAYQLVKDLSRVPEVIRDAAEKYEPSILTRHLVDVAQSFNKFYHDEHILVDNEDEKLAKLALVDASRIVIKNCLGLLGIEAPERM
ncbi:arginine--tRNA ligase [Clostridiales Family XIII bacterium RF-744-FAT-WT-3]|uniref:Arginine--tRNA ligase n=1 Tax=Baileyella intestinalis TaxID=2606709 RepID=A0A6A8M4G7_9FIRM|nr:arginine--tRNA ligase [Baileyella intestinalis]MST68195.1 arginine--tRNA ligase [Baileyella intestinalis]